MQDIIMRISTFIPKVQMEGRVSQIFNLALRVHSMFKTE